MSDVLYCPHCGARRPAEARLCPECKLAFADRGAHEPGGAPPRRRPLPVGWAMLGTMVPCAAALWMLAAWEANPTRHPNLLERVSAATLTLHAFDDSSQVLGQGSGFLIGPDGLSVSALHVMAGSDRATARTGDGRLFSVLEVQAFDADRDLIVFRIGRRYSAQQEWPSGAAVLSLASGSRIKVGDRVITLTSPEGYENSFSDGVVSAIREMDGQRMVQTTAALSPGSSGGPIMDRRGRVIAIATSQQSEGQNLSFGTPVETLSVLLRRREPMGYAELQSRLQERAIESWKSDHLTLSTDSAELREMSHGFVLMHAGYSEEALRHFRAASRLEPAEPYARYYAGLCLRNLGEAERAGLEFNAFLHMNPDSSWRKTYAVKWLEDEQRRREDLTGKHGEERSAPDPPSRAAPP